MRETTHQSPKWIYLVAFLLPFNGGLLNSVTLVSVLQSSVGYVTGNLTLAGIAFDQQQWMLFVHLLMLVVFFLIGSILSGLLIRNAYYHKDYRYSISLSIQFMLVLVGMVLLRNYQLIFTSYLLSMAMGLQNAMTSHYGSALIRTTHMTGTTTDLGIAIAQWIKGHLQQRWKITLYLTLIISFLLGAICGVFIYAWIQSLALCVSLVIYVVLIVLQKV